VYEKNYNIGGEKGEDGRKKKAKMQRGRHKLHISTI